MRANCIETVPQFRFAVAAPLAISRVLPNRHAGPAWRTDSFDSRNWISIETMKRGGNFQVGDWLARAGLLGPLCLVFASLKQTLSRLPKQLKAAGLATCATV